MGGFMAWILGSRNKDQMPDTSDPSADADEHEAFDHEAVQKPEPYFKGDAAPEADEPADSAS